MAEKEITTTFDFDARTLTVHFDGAEDLVLHWSKVHADNQRYAMYHGMKQRLVDATALGAWSKKLGRAPTIGDKRAQVKTLIDMYESGDDAWRREGFTVVRVDHTLEFLVLALTGYVDTKGETWTAEAAREKLKGFTPAKRSQIATDRGLPTWKHVEAQMEKERADGKRGSVEGL